MAEPKVKPDEEPVQEPIENQGEPVQGAEPEGQGNEPDENKEDWYKRQLGTQGNEIGELRGKIEALEADNYYLKQEKPAQPTQPETVAALNPMDDDFGEKLVSHIQNAVVTGMQTAEATREINAFRTKHNLNDQAARTILQHGFSKGASDPEGALKLFMRDFGDVAPALLSNGGTGNGEPVQGAEPKALTTPIKKSPSVPVQSGGGAAEPVTIPSQTEWDNMDDKGRKEWHKRVSAGGAEVNTQHTVVV